VIGVLEAMERCQKGPLMDVKEFNKKLQVKLREASAKLNIKLNLDEVIPPPDVADAVFEAAIDYGAEVGLYNNDTSRVLQFSRAELIETAHTRKPEFNIGEGKDMVTIRARHFGDKSLPVRMPGPAGVPITEEYYVPLHLSYAKLPEVQGIVPGCLTTARGFKNLAATPAEVVLAMQEARLLQEVARRAGKPGMPLGEVPMSAMNDPGIIAAYAPGGYRATNSLIPIQVYPGLKIGWHHLNIAAFAQEQGIEVWGMAFVVMGAFARDPIETAIKTIAGELALMSFTNGNLLYSATIPTGAIKSYKPVLPTEALKFLAKTRNMEICLVCTAGAVFKAATKASLIENALMAFAPSVAGAAVVSFGESGMGTIVNGSTGMEGKIICETAMAAAGVDDRKEANRIVGNVVSMLMQQAMKGEKGKTFPECYDVGKVEPLDEFRQLYADAKKDLRQAGIPFKY
jgi:methylamine--corrinoid protein Co-methyltransferase